MATTIKYLLPTCCPSVDEQASLLLSSLSNRPLDINLPSERAARWVSTSQQTQLFKICAIQTTWQETLRILQVVVVVVVVVVGQAAEAGE